MVVRFHTLRLPPCVRSGTADVSAMPADRGFHVQNVVRLGFVLPGDVIFILRVKFLYDLMLARPLAIGFSWVSLRFMVFKEAISIA
jgi:hypothetical protein